MAYLQNPRFPGALEALTNGDSSFFWYEVLRFNSLPTSYFGMLHSYKTIDDLGLLPSRRVISCGYQDMMRPPMQPMSNYHTQLKLITLEYNHFKPRHARFQDDAREALEQCLGNVGFPPKTNRPTYFAIAEDSCIQFFKWEMEYTDHGERERERLMDLRPSHIDTSVVMDVSRPDKNFEILDAIHDAVTVESILFYLHLSVWDVFDHES